MSTLYLSFPLLSYVHEKKPDKLFGSNLVKEEKVQSEIKGWQK